MWNKRGISLVDKDNPYFEILRAVSINHSPYWPAICPVMQEDILLLKVPWTFHAKINRVFVIQQKSRLLIYLVGAQLNEVM